MTVPGSFDAAITAALDAQAGHLLNLTVEVCSCGRPWTDVRDWARHRMAEGLGAALDVLGYGPSRGAQAAVDATEAVEGRSGGTGASGSVSGLGIGRDGPLRPPQSPVQPRTDAESPAASPDHPDAAETGTGPPVPPSREVAHAEIEDRTHPDVTAHAKYAYDVLFGHRPATTQED